jgi:Family of unknown function (DUF6644)
MHSLVMALAAWFESTPWGVFARESSWGYPFVQLIHFTGLSIWLGTTFALDLRLLGVGYRRSTAAQLAQGLFAWNWIGFTILLTGGFLLFSGLATLFVENLAFQWKLGLFVPLALIWHIVVQHRARDWGQNYQTPGIAKLAAAAEILLWICVAAAAVQIPSY